MPTLTSFETSSHCLVAAFINGAAIFVGADGQILLPHTQKKINIGDGLTCATISPNQDFVLTGGEDGRVCQFKVTGEITQLANFGKKWLTALSCGAGTSFAAAAGRTIIAFDGKQHYQWTEDRSVEGLNFAPKGLRLAVAHYNGVKLHWLGTTTKPVELEWKGAHYALTFSPDGKFLITAMQENALHGWRLSDEQHLRMTGYPSKVKSWSWSNKGCYLATSGAMAAVAWPFITKDGPMGKAPLELGIRSNMMVTCVACHPTEEMVAIGYEDGMILFVRFADNREVVLRHSAKDAITAMGWDTQGLQLVFGSARGECGLIDISS